MMASTDMQKQQLNNQISNLGASSPFQMAAQRSRLRIDSDIKAPKVNQRLINVNHQNSCFGQLTEEEHSSNITPMRQTYGDKIQINIPQNDEPPRVQKHVNPEET